MEKKDRVVRGCGGGAARCAPATKLTGLNLGGEGKEGEGWVGVALGAHMLLLLLLAPWLVCGAHACARLRWLARARLRGLASRRGREEAVLAAAGGHIWAALCR